MKGKIAWLMVIALLLAFFPERPVQAATTETYYILNTPIVYNVDGKVDGNNRPLGTSYTKTSTLGMDFAVDYFGGLDKIKNVEIYEYTPGSLDFTDTVHVLRNVTAYSTDTVDVYGNPISAEANYNNNYYDYSDGNVTYGSKSFNSDKSFTFTYTISQTPRVLQLDVMQLIASESLSAFYDRLETNHANIDPQLKSDVQDCIANGLPMKAFYVPTIIEVEVETDSGITPPPPADESKTRDEMNPDAEAWIQSDDRGSDENLDSEEFDDHAGIPC